jgi:hypothetical protein
MTYRDDTSENLEDLLEDDPEFAEEVKEELSELEEEIALHNELESDRVEDLQEQKRELEREIRSRAIDKDIEFIRENVSEYWADRFTEEDKRIRADHKAELEKRERAEEEGRDYWPPDKDAGRRRMELENRIDDAKAGMTPDRFQEIFDTHDEMLEHGENYHLYEEGEERIIGEKSYEENEENLDETLEEGRISRDEYYKWKRKNRNYHGK